MQRFSYYPAVPSPVDIRLVTDSGHPCPYLPDRSSRSRAFWADQIPPALYEQFMNAGFRRSGKIVYQPVCLGCRACQPIRVPVSLFRPSKSQRRSRSRNSDLTVNFAAPKSSDEKFELYCRYIRDWHDGAMDHDRDGFERFLYESPVDSLEFCYRDSNGRLLAVGICDVGPQSLSSVYFYFDPIVASRGLGTCGVLYEIEFAAKRNLPYYYLGYWVAQCGAMEYKAAFRPNELMCHDQVWRPG